MYHLKSYYSDIFITSNFNHLNEIILSRLMLITVIPPTIYIYIYRERETETERKIE